MANDSGENAERIICVLIKKLLEIGVLDYEDVSGMADELDAQDMPAPDMAGHLVRCSLLGDALDACRHELVRGQMRAIDGGKAEKDE